jgi:hypothetical protein
MEVLILAVVVAAVALVGFAALRWGADSRPSFNDARSIDDRRWTV